MEPQIANSLLEAARYSLATLWVRAMRNAISPEETLAIQKLGVAIALADRGVERVAPFPEKNIV